MIKERSQEILLSKTFLNTIKTKFNEEYLGLYNIDSESKGGGCNYFVRKKLF